MYLNIILGLVGIPIVYIKYIFYINKKECSSSMRSETIQSIMIKLWEVVVGMSRKVNRKKQPRERQTGNAADGGQLIYYQIKYLSQK